MFAAIEPFNGLGGLLDATQNVLRVPNLALPHPFGKGTDRFREPWRVIGRQKPAHASPLDNEVPFRTGTCIPGIPARIRSGSTNHGTGADSTLSHHRVTNRTRGIVVVDIDSIRAGGVKLSVKIDTRLVLICPPPSL